MGEICRSAAKDSTCIFTEGRIQKFRFPCGIATFGIVVISAFGACVGILEVGVDYIISYLDRDNHAFPVLPAW